MKSKIGDKMNVVIVGGGASGVICAIKIKEKNPNISVCILEQNERILKKVLKTGNGKCNIMNCNIVKEYYNDFSLIEANKDIDVYQELSSLGILLKEMTLGRIYPYSEQAQTVCNILINKLNSLNIDVITSAKVTKIFKENNTFEISYQKSNNEYSLNCDKVVLSSGSYAQEKTNGYDLAKKLGLKITPLSPGLTPLITKEKTSHLSGIRIKCDAHVYDDRIKQIRIMDGEILFKENGLSGILALDISRYVKKNDVIYLDLMKEYSKEDLKKIIRNDIPSVLEGIFPKMLAKDILDRAGKDKKEIIDVIKEFSFEISQKRDYNESQITLGGICLNEVTNSFESKKISGLFITGEILDCDGASGGYNLFFAWLSGIVCANKITCCK